MITSTPTPINIFLSGNFPASLAAIGAATTPPTIRPKTVCQWLTPRIIKNVSAQGMGEKRLSQRRKDASYNG